MLSPYTTLDQLTRELESRNLSKDALVQKSLLQAKISHGHIKRQDGHPYLERHIYPITMTIISHEELINHEITPQIVSGSLLHDVIEDDKNVNNIYFLNKFGQEMFDIVEPLTKSNYKDFPGNTKHDKRTNLNEHYLSILRKAPYESKIIKLADRDNNLETVSGLSDRKQFYYILETEKFYLPFAKEVSQYFYLKLRDKLRELNDSN